MSAPLTSSGDDGRARMAHIRKTWLAFALLLALASPAWAGSVRCTTYEEKSLGRLRTLCDDGTWAVHTYNKTLARWESTVSGRGTVAERSDHHGYP
jgi:hypothetical protein